MKERSFKVAVLHFMVLPDRCHSHLWESTAADWLSCTAEVNLSLSEIP